MNMQFKIIQFFIFITFTFWICQPKNHSHQEDPCDRYQCIEGGIVRGDTTQKEMSIIFSGDEFADGGNHILEVLNKYHVKASFFFTGNFYRNPDFAGTIRGLIADGHYLGPHSDRHLLYCDWEKRDSLLVTKKEFLDDLEANYREMKRFGISPGDARLFIPPFEWYNDSISKWADEAGYQLFNFTHGTLTNADYTTPDMDAYRSSEEIWQSITDYESTSNYGLNGFIMLIHIGTAPARTDKFYDRLENLILYLTKKSYSFKRIDELLEVGDQNKYSINFQE